MCVVFSQDEKLSLAPNVSKDEINSALRILAGLRDDVVCRRWVNR